MQKFQAKMFSIACAVAATCGGAAMAEEAPAAPAAGVSDIFPGDFNRALELMFEGEGGEGGIGMFRMWPVASAPALTSEQITQTVTGNSLVVPYHHTMQFNADGTVGGYTLRYDEAPLRRCPSSEVLGDNYLRDEGTCFTRTPLAYSGTWRVDDHQLCVNIAWDGGTLNDCYYVVFMLDSVGLYKSDGRLYAKGHKLRRGAALDGG